MNVVLQWIVPPLVGAVIGWVTNAIAIKMLFRPLAEKRVFGLRVPFTPGILPRQRRKLAANIGKMVSRELLTEAIVRERLRSPEFRGLVGRSVSGYTERLLFSPISRIAPFSGDLSRSVGAVVERFVSSEAFYSLVRTVVRSAAVKVGAKSPAELLSSAGSALPAPAALVDRLLSSLAEPETEARIAGAVERFLNGKTPDDPLGAALPGDAAERAGSLADLLYPIALEAALRFVNQPSVRAALEAKGKVILRDAILELNVFQRLFVSAAQYDKTLNERMPAIVDGFIARMEETARDEETRRKLSEAVSRSAERLLSKPAREALGELRTDPAAVSRRIAAAIVSFVKTEENGERLKSLAEGLAAGLGREPIDRILRERLKLDPNAIADMASFALTSYLRSRGGEAVPRLIDAFIAGRGEETLAGFLDVDAAEKAKWDDLVSRKAVELIDERVSAVIQSLDIGKMTSDRIDALEMEDVERIVLDVLADQLKWIDVFGAILGAIMGLFQSIFAFAVK